MFTCDQLNELPFNLLIVLIGMITLPLVTLMSMLMSSEAIQKKVLEVNFSYRFKPVLWLGVLGAMLGLGNSMAMKSYCEMTPHLNPFGFMFMEAICFFGAGVACWNFIRLLRI